MKSALGFLRIFIVLAAVSGAACTPLIPLASPTPEAPGMAALTSNPTLDHAHWGIAVRSLDTGEPIFTHQAEKLFLPASNLKLITGAVALAALGPDFRYQTEVLAAGPVRDGVLHGALLIRGSGDPTLSGRFNDDPRAPMRMWADSLRAQGIHTVAGPVIGIDRAFSGPPHGSGWAWEDLETAYGAEFGALQFNEGVVDLRIVPAEKVGDPAIVVLTPPSGYVRVMNSVTTGFPGSITNIDVSRDPGTAAIRVTGEIASDTTGILRSLPVRGPTNYFLHALRETLRSEGIQVQGEAMDADDWPIDQTPLPQPDRVLFTYASPSMAEILPRMMQPSQNWIAETLLRTLGSELRGVGSAESGVIAVDSLLSVWGIDPSPMRIVDGSGLSRYNLVSPEVLANLLLHMANGPYADIWFDSLPLAGRSGTLAGRMTSPPLLENVRAKTGTLSNIRTLAGYVDTADHGRVVFVILLNHYMASTAYVDGLIEAALAELATGS